MFRLDGKRALITGAGSGIGEATARLFAAQGAQILVADVQMDAAEQVAASIVKEGGSASALVLDVADETQVCAAFDRVANQDGRLDIVVNNAGISHVGNILETSLEDWDRVLRVNAGGVFLCAREAVRHMLQQEPKGGVIINLSSVAAMIGVGAPLAVLGKQRGGAVTDTQYRHRLCRRGHSLQRHLSRHGAHTLRRGLPQA